MNGNVPDMLRPGLPQTTMLGMNTPFMQNIQQSGQQQLATSHLGLPPSSNPPNSSMMLANAPGSMNPAQQHRYQLQLQQGGDARQQRPMQMRPGQPGQPMMGPSTAPVPGGGPGPHIVGMGHGQTMPFNPSMMTQASGNVAVRRVSSQPQMNQGPGPMGGMSPNAGNNNLSMGMPPQGSMPQIRQIPQGMQHQLGMRGQVHMPNQMSPDMPMPMNRQVGNPGLPGRTGSAQAQLMNSLPQPPSMQHPMVPQQNQFQNSTQIPPQHPPQIPSPRPGSHSQTHTPSMNMSTPGPSQTSSNRPQMNPDDPTMSFMNYPNPQFSQSQHTPRMLPQANGQFPTFGPSTPPGSMPDMPQPMSGGIGTPSGSSSRPSFQPTPAQQFEQMNNSPENFPTNFNMPPPSHVPPRPPSQTSPHPPSQLMSHPPLSHPQQLSHHSPHSSESHHPQRPQSHPQSMQRPSSQPVHTPRTTQSQLPPGPALPPSGRIGLPPHGPQPPSQLPIAGPGPGPQQLSIAPRPPPPQGPPGSGQSGGPQPPQALADGSPTGAARTQNALSSSHLNGQGLMRLLQFSSVLSVENKGDKLQLSWWNDLIKEYFTPKAMLKFTLWKDNQRNEAKQFEIGVPILPRFFLVTTQSGVKSMTFTLDGARERMLNAAHFVIECPGAVWTYKYTNGYIVTLRGPLNAHIRVVSISPPGSASSQASRSEPNVALKFEEFEFSAELHDKYIALDSITGARTIESPKMPHIRNTSMLMPNGTPESQQQRQQQLEEDKKWEEPRVTISPATIPGEPVNAFGIPQATMRCLELAESVSAMTELIAFSTEQNLGPREALRQFATRLRVMQPFNPPLINNSHPNHPPPPTSLASMHSNPGTGNPSTAPGSLYSSAPSSITNPSGNPVTPTGTTVSPKNAPLSASNSPQKQHKTIPQQTPGASSSSTNPASSPAVSSGATNNTPALSNASLKRKSGGDTTSSPTTVNAEAHPPQKRQNRRRRTTNASGPGTGGG